MSPIGKDPSHLPELLPHQADFVRTASTPASESFPRGTWDWEERRYGRDFARLMQEQPQARAPVLFRLSPSRCTGMPATRVFRFVCDRFSFRRCSTHRRRAIWRKRMVAILSRDFAKQQDVLIAWQERTGTRLLATSTLVQRNRALPLRRPGNCRASGSRDCYEHMIRRCVPRG
jgi:hypothetical protein